MWLLVGGVFLGCLVLFLLRSSDSLAQANHAFERLLPKDPPFNFLTSPFHLARPTGAQAEFARHGTNSIAVARRQLESISSTSTVLLMYARTKLLFEDIDVARRNWSMELARCALAVEALGEASEEFIPGLTTNLLHSPPTLRRNVSAAVLLAYAGPRGEQLLVSGLTNSDALIRSAAVDGLRHSLLRKATAPNRALPIAVDAQVWKSATAEHGYLAWLTDDWRKWGAQSAWMFTSNGVWLVDGQLQAMRSASLANRLTATSAIAALLKANHTGLASVRSNYVSACLDVLTDPEPSERGRAVAALADVDAGEPRALAALERTLSDPNRMVREDATNALRKLKR
ncbi:MAG: hypothetical protein FD161_319 [Limisphaerales bacterium]|nr:MAG: hypothetical protein FD161_319 [Limisphaerales bacterium]KAG0510765.1 MAG: hypothetical protein E1N63_319 [Limisphaerales bacterium]TXT52661.1 MAG: hypothetical protein FD140_581 [Limisphaerales bacterium]